MIPFMGNVEKMFEEEIERRVQERLNACLEKISRTYKLKLDRLVKDCMSEVGQTSSKMCCGLTKTKNRCRRDGKYDGYCKCHMDQKPKIVTLVGYKEHTHIGSNDNVEKRHIIGIT